eukprot:TRINITY_DN43597_c0_g1_i1.p1 TRINITY_DN43597_c0_g1~~TRINITY_DN43597_c0_g1_i1.p1  ORF type:complete len:299 (+),score=26.93 TRINITY_DN43597_c0_g1_i1:40-936(+)
MALKLMCHCITDRNIGLASLWCWCLSLGVALVPYNQTRAIEYAKISGASHCPKETLESWSCGWKCSADITSVKVCVGSTIQSFVGLWEGSCILSFQGSHDVHSFVQDLTFSKSTINWPACKNCMVHGGFLETYFELKPCLVAALRERQCSFIRGTGWSLGAAINSIAMIDLTAAGYTVEEVYDFGKPRVGDIEWVRHFENVVGQVVWRVTHHMDPIPHLPPQIMVFVHWNFRQAGPEAFYNSDTASGVVLCSPPSNHTECSGQFGNVVFDAIHVMDHFYHVDIRMGRRGCGESSFIKA